MELSNLKIFKAVADLGSVSKAADLLHYVQSNVTAQIQKLENELGAQLFTRSRRGMSLTMAGETLMSYASKTLLLADEARLAVAAVQAGQGTLHLGCMETVLAIHLSPALSKLRKAHPDIDLELITGPPSELLAAVLGLKLSGALTSGNISHPDIEQTHVFSEQLVLVTPKDVKAPLEWTQRTLLVFPTGCIYRSLTEQWSGLVGFAALHTRVLGSLEGILACASAGLGLTILPRASVARSAHAHQLKLHPLPPPFDQIETVLIRHRRAPHNPLLESLVAMLSDAEP